MNNLLYKGFVRHRRFKPKNHEFKYQIGMFYFDINDIANIFKPYSMISIEKYNWFSFRRKNYLQNKQTPLDRAVRELIQNKYNIYPRGKIYLLTQLTCLGYWFCPLSIYFVFKPSTQELDYLIAEVTNTPWGEKHIYVLDDPKKSSKNIFQYQFKKELHVSPFMKMDYVYEFNLKLSDEKIIVHMKSYRENELDFDATLSLSPMECTKRFLFRYVFHTYKIISAIYWQAFKLWLKGIKYRPHP